MGLPLEDALANIIKKKKNARWLSYHYYREYINSSFWEDKRKAKIVLKPLCECCGHNAQCVHHETYHRLWKERMSDLKSLCNDCHRKIHFIYNTGKNSKSSLRMAFHKLREELGIYPYWKWWEI